VSDNRVPRGSSWFFGASGARVAGRGSLDPSFRDDDVGSRLVEEVGPRRSGQAVNDRRVLRGGGWDARWEGPRHQRRATPDGSNRYRYRLSSSYHDSILGFRLVEEVEGVSRVNRGVRPFACKRGRPWLSSPGNARAALRFRNTPSISKDKYLGFRLAEEQGRCNE